LHSYTLCYIFVIDKITKPKTGIMKTKHTPGEWKVENLNGLNTSVIKEDKSLPLPKYKFICETYFNDDSYFSTKDECEANAKLIAAAPEMLEALILAENTIDTLEMAGRVKTSCEIKSKIKNDPLVKT